MVNAAAGLNIRFFSGLQGSVLPATFEPVQAVFIISTCLRILSLQLLRNIGEPEEAAVGQIVRILRNVRGLNTTNGFNARLNPFVEAPEPEVSRKRAQTTV